MGYTTRASVKSIGLLACVLATTWSLAVESPEAHLEGFRCREVSLALDNGEGAVIILVCQIGDSVDPIEPSPPPTPSLAFTASGGDACVGDAKSPSIVPWLTAQPSEPPQTQPHTP